MNLEYLHRPSENSEAKMLLILLHGYGSNMQDLFSFASDIPPHYEVVSMNAPFQTPYGGNAWYEINFMNAEKFNNAEEAQDSMKKILEDIDQHCQLWGCKPDQVNICGFSQGGILSYALSLNKPEKFKKVLCLSSYPAPEIIGKINAESDYSQLDFFISHGEEDAVIPIELGRKGKDLLDNLNIKYTFKEYYEGHGINPQNFQDIMNFL